MLDKLLQECEVFTTIDDNHFLATVSFDLPKGVQQYSHHHLRKYHHRPSHFHRTHPDEKKGGYGAEEIATLRVDHVPQVPTNEDLAAVLGRFGELVALSLIPL